MPPAASHLAAGDRSLAEVLRDVLRNLQEIMRSEVLLAKTELMGQVAQAKSSVLLIVAGAVTGLFAALFLLLAIVFAMVLIMPIWAAMLLPGIALAVAASILIFAGVMRTRQRPPMLERTLASIKENVAWAQQHSK